MRINTNVDAMRAYSNYATWNAAKRLPKEMRKTEFR